MKKSMVWLIGILIGCIIAIAPSVMAYGKSIYSPTSNQNFLLAQTNQGICRQLQQGDKWYPGWHSCCDLGNDRSRWTNSNGVASDWGGSCSYWGIGFLPENQTSICRQLQQGDKWYPEWRSCCDLGNEKSRWTNSSSVASDWGGSCSYWGIR
jgi:hypothetical protein